MRQPTEPPSLEALVTAGYSLSETVDFDQSSVRFALVVLSHSVAHVYQTFVVAAHVAHVVVRGLPFLQ